MTLHVRLFARARDLAGTEVLAVELPPGATVEELRRRLGHSHPELTSLLPRSAIAVDQEFAPDTLRLREEAEVALLPPVSGG
jgi:molybdopterin converting factor subunit 1